MVLSVLSVLISKLLLPYKWFYHALLIRAFHYITLNHDIRTDDFKNSSEEKCRYYETSICFIYNGTVISIFTACISSMKLMVLLSMLNIVLYHAKYLPLTIKDQVQYS